MDTADQGILGAGALGDLRQTAQAGAELLKRLSGF